MEKCERCDNGKIECPHCKGSGYEPSSTDMSLAGWVEAVGEAAHNVALGPEECQECQGEKTIDCPDCGGAGEV